MTQETNALEQGGGNALSAETEVSTPAPKSDAEAAQQEAAAEAAKAQKQGEEANNGKGRNRTREYIERLQQREATMRRELEEIKRRLPPEQQEEEREPTPEDFGWDQEKYAKALLQFNLKRERASWEKEQQERTAREKAETDFQSYAERRDKFRESHPDFDEVVELIPFIFSEEARWAMVRHPKGPEIIYHIANNEDDAFFIANTQPQNAAAAVDRIAARLGQAQEPAGKPDAGAATNNGLLLNNAAPKPVTKAPAPPASVKGSSPTDIPDEKLTDDEWLKRTRERERKR